MKFNNLIKKDLWRIIMLHYNINMLQNNSPNSSKIFSCDFCLYTCNKKSNFEKHLQSIKDKSNKFGNECNTNIAASEMVYNII
jgi:hypothetical protein